MMSNFEIIAKFGGTSVAQPELVRNHVLNDDPAIVVVSAPGVDRVRNYDVKVTDMLLAVKDGADNFEGLQERYGLLADAMSNGEDPGQDTVISGIADDIRLWQAKGWPIEALGERWAAQMYASFLGRQFVDATEVVRFDANGQLDLAESERLARDRFNPFERYVVPGFYGADARGDVHVAARGGSDITQAIFSRALGAEESHNWSDVDGFMTADPARYSDADLLTRLNYCRVLDMAEAGCQLLHPDVCRILGGTAVNTIMRNTFGEIGNRGTQITDVVQRQAVPELLAA